MGSIARMDLRLPSNVGMCPGRPLQLLTIQLPAVRQEVVWLQFPAKYILFAVRQLVVWLPWLQYPAKYSLFAVRQGVVWLPWLQ